MVLTNKHKFFIFAAIGVVAIYLMRKKLISVEQMLFIRNLNPKAKAKFKKFVDRVKRETGYEMIFTSGYRTFAEQDKLRKENSKNAQAGNSFHNYGMAIDINAIKGTSVLKKASSKTSWNNSGIPKIAKELGLRWGGDFKGYYDPIHFDLGNDYKTSDLKVASIKKYGSNPSNIKGNRV